MDYSKLIVSNQKEESISIQRVKRDKLVCSPYFQWMNTRTLVTIDTSERIHVIDVRSEEELEVNKERRKYSKTWNIRNKFGTP